MNVLITGGNGQLGETFKDILSKSQHTNEYIITTKDELDICDDWKVMQFVINNDIRCIINCAAYTDVDGAADNKELAEKINETGPYILSKIMRKVNGLLIHISTDYVFGSKYNTPIGESFEKHPENTYGLTKSNGEDIIIGSGCKYLIFRTSWLYSEFSGKNFLKKILKLIDEKQSLKVVCNQIGTPTYARDLAEMILDVIETGKYDGNYGIYNFSNSGSCSWYDFAEMIRIFTHNDKCTIHPCNSNDFPTKEKRPEYSVLDKTKIQETFGIQIPIWTDSLKKCLWNLNQF